MQRIPIKATYLDIDHPEHKQKIMEKALEGNAEPLSFREEQIKEIQRLAIKKGLNVDYLLDKYKNIVDSKIDKVRASDVLKALDSVRNILELDNKSESTVQVRAMVQSKSATELTTTLIEITTGTQQYLEKLKRVNDH